METEITVELLDTFENTLTKLINQGFEIKEKVLTYKKRWRKNNETTTKSFNR